ncbi:MAG: DUF2459 domain-containing protein [Proteobacteria bacterium]|nr:DUF2459 domain-containing protein [Pseudomonadota bacterium]
MLALVELGHGIVDRCRGRQSDGICLPRPRPWIALVLGLLLTACAAPPPAPPPSQPDLDAKTIIFVASNGWHSSIILAKADLPPGRLAEAADFPEARFLEFGWGDAVYYPARRATLGMTLRAALVPTPAVVHVVGLRAEPARSSPEAEVVSLALDDKNFGRLVDFIDASFERAGAPRAAATGPGLTTTSRFYPAKGRFHLFNTCNTWTARALAAAGFDVSASGTFRAEALMQQVRALVRPR